MRILLSGLLGLFLLSAPALADGKGQVRVINSTGKTLTKVTIRTCEDKKVVGKLKRGEKIARFDVRFWRLDPGCYEVLGPNNGHRFTIKADLQFDAPLR